MSAPGLVLDGHARVDGMVLFGPLRLEIPAGGWTCLLGPSGVGKSTILRLIAGLDTGAEFDGSVSASDGAAVGPRVAYMAQEDLLMPWLDVLGNVYLGSRLRGELPDRDRATALLDRVGLADHRHKRPAHLSGGQRQRVALARTLMEDRPIVLLDEPFSALDARTRSQMQDLAAEVLTGRTVLLVTHEPGEAARLGEQIYVLSRDELRALEPPSGAIPRGVNEPETLSAQGQLLTLLRAA